MRAMAVGVILLALAVGAPTAATPPPEQAGRPQAEDGERRICRSSVATGSRLRRTRTCLTAQEWQAREEGARQAAREIELRGRIK